MTDRMPCMAVKQPYASLLVGGVKDVENRNRALPDQLRGKWCAIYASKTMAPAGLWAYAAHLAPDFHLWKHTTSFYRDIPAARKQCTRGAIVGLVRWDASRTVRKAMDAHMSPWADPGAHHWTYLDRIVLPEPVPLPNGGCQSLYWYLSDETREQVHAAINAIPHHQVRRSLIFTPHSFAMAQRVDGITAELRQNLAKLTGCDV